MSKPFCGPHMIMETTIALIQVLFLTNELCVLYTINTDYWVVNPYIDTVVFVLGHLFNFFYYKIKCREHTLTKQTIIELTNVCISMIIIFLLIQLTPNVSISIYRQQSDNLIVFGLIIVQFILMTAILSQFQGIVQGTISMISRCYINYTRKKNSKLQPSPLVQRTPVVSTLLDDLDNEIESNSERLSQSFLEP